MAKNNIIVVRAPEGAHIRIARRDNVAEATHEVLASWEIGLFVKLFELHITRTLAAKYSEGICWDWESRQGWRELLPLNGQVSITVHLPTGEDRKVFVRRVGDMNIAVREGEQNFFLLAREGEMKEKIISALLDAAARNGYPSCIPGPWCLRKRKPLDCPECIKEIPLDLRKEAEKLWGSDSRAHR